MADPSRRTFLKRGGASALGAAFAPTAAAGPFDPDAPLVPPSTLGAPLPLRTDVERVWLGPEYWANRLQDWRLTGGRAECVEGAGPLGLRTVALLPYEVTGEGSFRVEAEVMLAGDAGGGGMGGFLVGAGAGRLDWRAAALVQQHAGQGGGLLAVVETDGRCRFRDHTSETDPTGLAPLGAAPLAPETAAGPLAPGAAVRLVLEGAPGPGGFRLRLQALDPATGRRVAGAVIESVDPGLVRGSVMLASAPYPGTNGARWSFAGVRVGGDGAEDYADRSFGPVAGLLYSLPTETLHPDGPRGGAVLKLTAQLLPVGDAEPGTVRLQARPSGQGAYRTIAEADLDRESYTTLFRLPSWDATRDHDVRVAWTDGGGAEHAFAGRVRRDPADADEVRVGLFSCVTPTAVDMYGGPGRLRPPETRVLGRFTDDNLYFPHAPLARHAAVHDPDLAVFCGDQIYEGSPTPIESREDPHLDYFYKWLLWVWSFRDLTRDRPSVLLVDDHDVYHPNVWGQNGKKAPVTFGGWNEGGYVGTAEFVNAVQRTQCDHDPDPYDPTPVERGITVYYGAFRFGGVDFAILEDRKFKTSPLQGEDMDVHTPELLGGRQEAFLADWGARRAGGPKVALTQTLFGCLQTDPAGRPLLDFDSNGYPALARDRAVGLLRDAGALVLAGDQHLASVVRLGIDGFDDGPVQFAGPAGGSVWQRWFEPAAPLPGAGEQAHTGDFRDAFGNRMHVLAVANPAVSFAEYRAHRTGRDQSLGQRDLKSEGYGIVRVDKRAGRFVLECWPYDADPETGRQFAGWPQSVPFDEAGRG